MTGRVSASRGSAAPGAAARDAGGRRPASGVVVAGTAAAVVAVAGAALAQAGAVLVVQRDREFAPAELTVPRGTEVVFRNEDPYLHHVFVDGPGFSFDSGDQRPGRDFAVRFDRQGRFLVRCAIHLKMRLPVAVE
jgi:plastocyanin